MKLMIAIPSTGYMHYATVQSLANMTKHLAKIATLDFDVVIHGGTQVHLAREELTNKAIDGEYSHVLWIDSDMVFDNNAVDYLIKTMNEYNCDLVSGVFRSRHGGLNSCVFDTLQPDHRIDEYPDNEFRIEGCGMAFVLTKTDMLQKIWNAYGHCFLPNAMYSEDLAMCHRAKLLGFNMMANPLAKVGHMCNGILWPNKSFEYI